LADLTALARDVADGKIDLPTIERQLDDLASRPSPWPRQVAFMAPGVSAAAATIMFSGTVPDATATLGIALAVQPLITALDRWSLPPFFRVGIAAAVTSALVALLVAVGAPVAGGLVLTGSLLRFLPGYALVAGFRDLIDQSIVSGTARLAEALLLAAAIAGGTVLAGALLAPPGVDIRLSLSGGVDRPIVVSGVAAAVVVAAFAVLLDVPPRIVPQAALMGALGWLLVVAPTPARLPFDPSGTMILATVLIGAAGAILARRARLPSALWVVPAVLPLLPGLQLVTAMLAPTDLTRLLGLLAAGVAAFLIGAGVAIGEILVRVVRNVRRSVVAPAVGMVADGIQVGIAGAVQRVNREVQDKPRPGGVDGDPDRP
ncbi:MAG TPA: threonine/serine exporter family protein, partial [Candidatus Limnocylindrales bacterium]